MMARSSTCAAISACRCSGARRRGSARRIELAGLTLLLKQRPSPSIPLRERRGKKSTIAAPHPPFGTKGGARRKRAKRGRAPRGGALHSRQPAQPHKAAGFAAHDRRKRDQ